MATNRRSCDLLSQILEESDIRELESKRRELEQAMCNEFREIFERQNDFEIRLANLENSKEVDSPIRLKSHEDAKLIDLQQKIDATSESCTRLINDLKTRVKSLETENKKLNAQNTKLENLIEASKVDEELIKLNRESREVQRDIENLKKTTEQSQNNSTIFKMDRIAKINVDIPKFKGTVYERPIKYLAELENYVIIKKANINEIKLILNQSLENEAKDWWYVNEDEVNSLEKFADLFKDRFWNTNVQRKLKRKIECGQYIAGGKTSRANYATHLFSIAKDLDSEYDEEELIKLISEQYDREIKYAIKSNARNKNEMFKILAEFDDDDKQLRETNREKSQNSNQNKSNQNKSNNNNFKRDFKVQTTELKKDEISNKTHEKKKNQNEKSKLDDKSKLASDLYKDIDVLAIDLDPGNAQ